MRLSAYAQELLAHLDLDTLQKLPLERLLDKDSYDNFIKAYMEPNNAIENPTDSLPLDCLDPVFTSSLDKAVVVSSGYIYSKKSVDELIGRSWSHDASPSCPMTREELEVCDPQDIISRRLGTTSGYYVRLPQIDAAIERFRAIRDGDKPKPTSVSQAAVISQPEALCFQQTDTLIRMQSHLNTLSQFEDCSVRLEYTILKNHIRIYVRKKLTPLKELFDNFFENLFNHNEKSQIRTHKPYSLAGKTLGRCWRLDDCTAQLEFWFPTANLTNEEAKTLFVAFITPLNLNRYEINSYTKAISLNTINPDSSDYRHAFFYDRKVSLESAARCLVDFFAETESIAAKQGVSCDDTVVEVSVSRGPTMYGKRPHSNEISDAQQPRQGLFRTEAIRPSGT